jgi:hypothetical protein
MNGAKQKCVLQFCFKTALKDFLLYQFALVFALVLLC